MSTTLADWREQKERREEWNVWWARERGTQLGAVYRWLRDDAFAPLDVFLFPPDGNMTANIRETDGLLREAWGPINRKYAESPQPCPVAFLAKYGCRLRKSPVLASKLTGRFVLKHLGAPSPSSVGLDRWGL